MTRPTSYYSRTVASLTALAVLIGLAMCWQAGRLYAAGSRGEGWTVGMLGLGLPTITLAACVVWLAILRRRGEPDAGVRWIRWALPATTVIWLGFLAFSLM